MNDKDFEELSAAHALNALSPDDERALNDALAADPALQAQVDADIDAAARLAETVAEVVPPVAVRTELLARIAVTPQQPRQSGVDARPAAGAPSAPDASSVDASAAPGASSSVPDASSSAVDAAAAYARSVEAEPRGGESAPGMPPAPARGRWGTRAWFALAASIVLVLGIGGAVAIVSQQLTPPASVVALERIESAPDAQSAASELADGGEATLHWSESLGEAVLVSDDLPSIGADHSFELWYVRDGAAISAGVFSADGGAATAELSGAMHAGDVIAVTVEPSGGSPDGTPSTEPIVAIATA